jgi:transcriptional regulator with XRE-family HTH domain
MLTNLKIRLMEMKISQRRLSKRLKIFESYLSEIIHERKRPSAKLRARIARIVGEPESELFPAPIISDPTSQTIAVSSEALQ